jgi:hydrophobe/amphiphile efflux-1 (HAE1) family protein
VNISEPFIKRPAGTSLLAAGLFLMGIVAFRFLPVSPLPRVDFPVISVSASLPGADPETVASSLAAPLERRISQIAGVTELTSVSTLGGCSINIQFDLDRNVDGAARDVQAAINAAQNELPADLPSQPTYRKVNPADSPILILAMTSDTLPPQQVYEYADEIIGQRLSQIEGVSQVTISGAEKSAVRVQADPAALASAGMSLEDIRTFLASVNVDLPKGSVDGPDSSYAIYTNDQLMQASAYRGLILSQTNSIPIPLGNFAKVIDGVENTLIAGWAGRQPAVLVIVFKQPTANVIETVDRIKAALPLTEKWIPPSVKLQVMSDRTITIRASVDEVEFSLLLSIALVVMVIFLFLRRFWPTFIAGISIPLSLAGTFGVMYLLHYSLDNLSLMAVTISVGFVVDDAIVVIENVFRYIEQGMTPMEAALTGARQIGFTIVSISLSLIAVFIPLLFMAGLVGRLFHEFAVTLSAAILVSGVVSLTLTPMLCSRFLQPESKGGHGVFYRACEACFDAMLRVYETGLKWVLRNQGFILVVWILTVILTLWLYTIVPSTLFPQQDTGMIMGTTEASQDISFSAMKTLQDQVAQIVLQDPAVDKMASFVGASAGGSSTNNGRMFISLKPRDQRDANADQVIARIRRKAVALTGINLFMQAAQDLRVGARSSKGQYQYSLQSGNLDELNTWAPRLVDKLKAYPALKDVTSDQLTAGLQKNVVINRDAASRLGVSPDDIDNTLYDAFGQRQVSILYKAYNQHHVILEASPGYQLDPSSLDKIYVKSSTGIMVPLSALSSFQTTNTFLSVGHQGQFPCVTVSFNLAPGASLDAAQRAVAQATQELRMPSDILGSFQGTAQVWAQSQSTLWILVLAAIVTVYIVLGMLYESLIHPITILTTIPSAGVGALLAMLIFGTQLSLVAFIGIILLIGIVKKNAIMMIDFALHVEREENLTPEESIYKACVIRFRPIMMTTMAAMLGAVPLAIGIGTGSELRQPLGISVIGGLVVSQVLTLYTTPVIYLFFEHARQFVARLRGRTLDGAPLEPARAL